MTQYKDEEIDATHGEWFSSLYYEGWRENFRFQFRFGPIPGTRKYGSYFRNTYRNPNHIAMRRAYFQAIEDGVPLRQKWVEIPDPWDDRPRWDGKNRSWKKYRKTQYKYK